MYLCSRLSSDNRYALLVKFPCFLVIKCQLIIVEVVCSAGCGALLTGLEGLHADVSTVITYLMGQVTSAVRTQAHTLPPSAAPEAAKTEVIMEKATNSTSTTLHAGLDSL